jgi:hypothetical protein
MEYGFPEPCREVVIDDDIMPLLSKGPYHVTADIACSAGYEDLHD